MRRRCCTLENFLRQTSALALIALVGHSEPLEAKGPKCFPREGHCVAVVVNGQPTVAATKATKKLLRGFDEASHYISDVRYEVPEPISGELDVAVAIVAGAEAALGDHGQADVQIVPLQEVEIETESGLVADPTVRIDGQAALSAGRFLRDNRLPAGVYLLRVKLRGTTNWDRQTVFLTVDP